VLVCLGQATVSFAVLLPPPAAGGLKLTLMLDGFFGSSFSLLRATVKAGLSMLYWNSASTANTFLNGTTAAP
jgi:hypothetical protein